ncbi:MAG: triose-phosphate isomerase [Rhodospirillales bacterium]|jgi:triosephosphate isomerase|nr:triose-phosphate isomerase [Rhodospirillales bacterium]
MTVTRRPLIAGNWKMNGLSGDGLALAEELARRIEDSADPDFDLLICPPFTLIQRVGAALAESTIALGGQDCHAAESGAHTGDISAAMLADAGCSHVIVGHSERRADHAETDAWVRAKAGAARAAGLVAVICIGETEAQRDGGETTTVVARQLAASLPDGATAENTVIAYEPVWAIGTGRTPSVTEVEAVHALIRGDLAQRLGDDEAARLRVLYGGSVKPGNARELMSLTDVDGALVGGASLHADDFWSIAQSSA